MAEHQDQAERWAFVQKAKEPVRSELVSEVLDALAASAESLGYKVIRWRSACEDKVNVDHAYDLAIVWGGMQVWMPPLKAKFIDDGTDVLYAEMDDFGHYRRDSSWKQAEFTLGRSICPQCASVGGVCGFRDTLAGFRPSFSGERLAVRKGPLLAILQDDQTLATHREASPCFRSNEEFVRWLAEFSRMPVLVRPHPDYGITKGLREFVGEHANTMMDDSPDIESALDKAAAVACIDSHCGIRAMDRHLPVLCYGMAIYRIKGAAYRLILVKDATRWITGELSRGICRLDRGAQRSIVDELKRQTWRLGDLPGRLERYLAAR